MYLCSPYSDKSNFSVLSFEMKSLCLLSIFLTFYWIFDLFLLIYQMYAVFYYQYFFSWQIILCLNFSGILVGKFFCFHLIHGNQPVCIFTLVLCSPFFWRLSIHFLHKNSKILACFGPYLGYINFYSVLMYSEPFFCLFCQIALFWISHFAV